MFIVRVNSVLLLLTVRRFKILLKKKLLTRINKNVTRLIVLLKVLIRVVRPLLMNRRGRLVKDRLTGTI